VTSNADMLRCLVESRKLIEREENWCVGYLHRMTFDGRQQHCAVGALQWGICVPGERCNPGESQLLDDALAFLAGFIPAYVKRSTARRPAWDQVALYNNDHTHEDVLALFDRAIERCQQIEELKTSPETHVPERPLDKVS
jgi:hypothetical protein